MTRPKGIGELIVIYCTAGAGWAKVADASVSITPGRVLLIPAGSPHAYGAADDRPWTIHWMHLAGPACGAVEQMLLGAGSDPLITVGQDAGLSRLFQKTFDVLCEPDAPGALLRASLTAAGVLDRLSDAVELLNRRDEPDDRMTRVIHHMWRHVNGRVTLEGLAREASLSTSHFASSFRRHTGLPPLDYFYRLQMQQAAHLLDHTALPIKAVAARLGYEDPLYFSRRFRKYHDTSPAQYRAARGE